MYPSLPLFCHPAFLKLPFDNSSTDDKLFKRLVFYRPCRPWLMPIGGPPVQVWIGGGRSVIAREALARKLFDMLTQTGLINDASSATR